MENIYEASRLIGDAYASQIKDASPQVSVWLLHKLKHSFGVAHDIMDIFYAERDLFASFSPAERQLVEISAILHDLGRFYQHRNGQHLSNREYDHGIEAAKMLTGHPYFNQPALLFAIAEHNHFAIDYTNPYYTNLPPAQQKFASLMARLLRDADKLENMRYFAYHNIDRIGQLPQGVLSAGVKNCLRRRTNIISSEIRTASDGAVGKLAWINDICFASTLKRIKELDFIDSAILALKERGASDADIDFLKTHLNINEVTLV
ncbi:MAG: HD domain-containing protein [Alphaproteobacteria bacterium]|nr:HD domain-containing protein [Alphaproteobacteria bacterium]